MNIHYIIKCDIIVLILGKKSMYNESLRVNVIIFLKCPAYFIHIVCNQFFFYFLYFVYLLLNYFYLTKEKENKIIFNKQITVLHVIELSEVILFLHTTIQREWFNSAILP